MPRNIEIKARVDDLDALGDFMELEVVLAADEPPRAGIDEAHALMARLGIAPQALVQGAYRDLLDQAGWAGIDTAVNHRGSNP